MTDGITHLTDLPFSTLVNGDSQGGCLVILFDKNKLDFGRGGFATFNKDAFSEFFESLLVGDSFDDGLIFLF